MPSNDPSPEGDECITVFLCGDVMTGRGIDQILRFPCDPVLYEPWVKDARRYYQLAEQASGPVPRPVDDHYIWGDALEVWNHFKPDCRIVNLETAITTSDRYWQGKEIHYRMSPRNIGCLTAAGLDCCALANNHLLDWGRPGLTETLASLQHAGIQTAGAGENLLDAQAPAIFDMTPHCRLLVFSMGAPTCGIPFAWAAQEERSGVYLLPDLSDQTARRVSQAITEYLRRGDIVVASIHWGGNWGYEIEPSERRFAHQLIEQAGVDIVHGHSSHHIKGIEVYRERLILYGCGDFLTDYEGITGHEAFRGDLAAMYFASLDASSGRLLRLQMALLRSHRLRLRRTGADDTQAVRDILNREGEGLGTRVRSAADGLLELEWDSPNL
jgi:poly-gamma-glutamate synthesis protein (capsule biosynthesis protein)